MKRIVIIIAVVVAIPLSYWLISPLFIDEVVEEKLEDISPIAQTAAEGSFEGQGLHNAEGRAVLVEVDGKHYVRFEDGFSVTNGPDLFVHFGKDGKYVKEANLGSLKGNIGGQNYEVPEGLNPEDYNEVWIWCRAFAVPFARAVLE